MKTVFCCDALEAIVDDPDCPLKYKAYVREFILTAPDYLRKKSKKYNIIYPNYTISHCPRCGTKLPESLFDEWYDVMEKEFGLTGMIGQDREHLIPEQYKTDEWWKKRGL